MTGVRPNVLAVAIAIPVRQEIAVIDRRPDLAFEECI
jgi:hypothetical protein